MMLVHGHVEDAKQGKQDMKHPFYRLILSSRKMRRQTDQGAMGEEEAAPLISRKTERWGWGHAMWREGGRFTRRRERNASGKEATWLRVLRLPFVSED